MHEKLFTKILRGGFLLLFLGSILGLHAESNEPGEEQLAHYVKKNIPSFLSFRFIKTTPGKVTEKETVIEGMLTAVAGQHLYRDVTLEAIPELASATPLPAGLIAPTVLKKIHGSGEILEIPLQVIFKKNDEGYWAPVRLEDHGQFEQLGKPMEDQKMGALIQGNGQTNRAITQFRKEYSKALASKTAKPRPSAPFQTVERSESVPKQEKEPSPPESPEKEAVTPTPTANSREAAWNALAAACRAGHVYSGILPSPKGATKVYLQFKGFEQQGTSISGEVVDQLHSFSRRTFTGMMRPNSSVAALFQLDLIVNEPLSGRVSTATTPKKTFLSLILDHDRNLIGEITSKSGTKLTQKKLESGDYTLLFTP